jgi:hypothetical protein
MTQRQLDLQTAARDVNSVLLDIDHKVEIREKGTVVGIYTLSGAERKKRGVALPLESFISLQKQLPVINLKIQLATGTVGLDLLEAYQYALQPSFQPAIQPSYGSITHYNDVSYEQKATVTEVGCESYPKWHQPSTGESSYISTEGGYRGAECLQPSQIKYELCQPHEAVKYYYG